MDEMLLALIQKHIPSVNTTETQCMDSLDFHDVHISSLVDLVKESIQIGIDLGITQACHSR